MFERLRARLSRRKAQPAVPLTAVAPVPPAPVPPIPSAPPPPPPPLPPPPGPKVRLVFADGTSADLEQGGPAGRRLRYLAEGILEDQHRP